jgi:hypothetical protein
MQLMINERDSVSSMRTAPFGLLLTGFGLVAPRETDFRRCSNPQHELFRDLNRFSIGCLPGHMLRCLSAMPRCLFYPGAPAPSRHLCTLTQSCPSQLPSPTPEHVLHLITPVHHIRFLTPCDLPLTPNNQQPLVAIPRTHTRLS